MSILIVIRSFPIKFFSLLLLIVPIVTYAQNNTLENIYNIKVYNIDQKPLNLSEFKNKVILIFNFSSKCATASQLSDFENLRKRFAEQNLIVIGAPSSDFAPMYIKNPDALKDFCKNKFQASFHILSELHVTGEQIHPLFSFLTKNKNPELDGEVSFNMEKFLISKDGVLIKRYNPFTGATSKKLIEDIQEALN